MNLYRFSQLTKLLTVAGLFGFVTLTTSCQQDIDAPQQTVGQTTSVKQPITVQELSEARSAFESSGLVQKLTDSKPTSGASSRALEWQPQWQKAFKVNGAVHVPLLYKTRDGKLASFTNAKRYLVTGGPAFAIATYVFASDKVAATAGDSFFDTFTGQLAQRELSKNEFSLLEVERGGFKMKPAKAAANGTASRTTEDCQYTTECYWQGSCAPDETANTAVTYGEQDCSAPTSEACEYSWGASWSLYNSITTSDCSNGNGAYFPGNGYFMIRARHSGKVLDVPNYTMVNNSQIVQWTQAYSQNQKWQFLHLGSGYYMIASRNSQINGQTQVLAWDGFSPTNARVVIQNSAGLANPNPPLNQVWFAPSLGAGYHALRTASDLTGLIAVQSASRNNGARLIMYPKASFQEGDNEEFTFVPVNP